MDIDKLFIRGVWQLIPSEDDASWVTESAKEPKTETPCGDKGELIQKFLDAGVSPQDISRFARIIGYEVAFNLCYHLDDPSASYEAIGGDEIDREWALVEIRDEEIVDVVPCIHESLLSEDPSGREMRPRRDT